MKWPWSKKPEVSSEQLPYEGRPVRGYVEDYCASCGYKNAVSFIRSNHETKVKIKCWRCRHEWEITAI